MSKILLEQVRLAYKKLKQAVYYEKSDLQLRIQLAKFECSDAFEDSLSIIQETLNAENPAQSEYFKKWLANLNYRITHKSISFPKENNCHENFTTNVTSSKEYKIDKVNHRRPIG